MTLLLGLMLVGSASQQVPPIRGGPPLVIDEGRRPTGVWRTVGGTCFNHTYEISISPGKPLGSAVKSVVIDGVLVNTSLAFPPAVGSPVSVSIDGCQKDRARIRFDVPQPTEKMNLIFYRGWIGADGTFTPIVGQ